MLFFKESVWLLLANASIGFIIGYFKGMPRVGFLLGFFLGPIGWGIAYLLPSQRQRILFRTSPFDPRSRPAQPDQSAHVDDEAKALGTACPRCGKTVSKSDQVCPDCGNVLIKVRYKVHGKDGSKS